MRPANQTERLGDGGSVRASPQYHSEAANEIIIFRVENHAL